VSIIEQLENIHLSMSFLLIKENKVICTDDGHTLKEIQKIYNNDKTGKGKTYFNDVITAIYYLYKPRGVYWNKSLQERIEIVNSDHLKNQKWEQLLKMDGVRELVEKYINLSWTINDKLYDDIKSDVDEVLNELHKVPTTITIEINAEAEVLCDDGVVHKVKVSAKTPIPNFKQKKELWDYSLSLSKLVKEVQTNLKEESNEREKQEALERLYDSREKNKVTE
jgi:hypothetical protein